MTKSKGILRARHVWTGAQDAELTKRYPNETAPVLAAHFVVSESQIYTRAYKLKLAKSPEFFASSSSGRLDGVRGSSSRFEKGNVPWTKGLKGLHLSPGTEFKPGSRPVNYMEVGAEKMHVGYVWVKVAEGGWPDAWRPKHHVLWESIHGAPPPPGYILSFIDRDRKNFDPTNLELVSRVEWIRRHTRHNLPKPLADLIALRGALTRQINKRREK